MNDLGVQRLLLAPGSTLLAAGAADEQSGSPDLTITRVFNDSGPVGRPSALVLTQAMKAAFGRSRPELEPLVDVGSLSFPSGHAMNAMVFYTVIAYVVGQIVGRGPGRAVVYALGGVVVVLVGWTRLYLGVHYPSDVAAGYAVGYSWAIACCVLIEARTGRKRDVPARTPE